MTSRVCLVSLAVFLVVFGCGGASSTETGSASHHVSASPSPDPAVTAYASMVNNDVNALDVQVYKKFSCKSRDLCISELRDIRVLTESLLDDLDRTAPPAIFIQPAASVRRAAQQFIVQIDSTLAQMEQPNSNYVAESGALDVHPLDLATGALVCWPKSVEPREVGESPSGYVCI